jgi:hypothetical protein
MWNVKARVALAAGEWDTARDSIERALTSLEAFDVPNAARRIHATAAKYYSHAGDPQAVEHHRAKEQEAIANLVASLPVGDPLGRYLQAE